MRGDGSKGDVRVMYVEESIPHTCGDDSGAELFMHCTVLYSS